MGLAFPGFGLLSLAPPLRCTLTLGSKAFPSLQHDCITGFVAAQHSSLSKGIFPQMSVQLLITCPLPAELHLLRAGTLAVSLTCCDSSVWHWEARVYIC